MKNWTIKEAVAVVQANADLAAVREITTHFPDFALAVARNDLGAIAAMMGDKFTVRRLNAPAVDQVEDDQDADDAEPQADVEIDLSTMSAKELMKLCDARGIKVPHYGKNKQFYLDALTGAGDQDNAPAPKKAAKGKAKAAPVEDDEDEADDEDEYAGKTAPELFKECKKRGIKAAAKKPAKYYIDLLEKADAEAADDDDDEGGWGDEDEDEAPTPAPKAKGGKAKGGKAKAAPQAEAADDDDDWDI